MFSPQPKAQHNFTDPESRIMKGLDGFVQAHNAQGRRRAGAAVDRGTSSDPAGQ
jgi:hypothetical protein